MAKNQKTVKIICVCAFMTAALMLIPAAGLFYDQVLAWDNMTKLAVTLLLAVSDIFVMIFCLLKLSDKVKTSVKALISFVIAAVLAGLQFIMLNINATKYNGSLAELYIKKGYKLAAVILAVVICVGIAAVFAKKRHGIPKALGMAAGCVLCVYMLSPISFIYKIHIDKYKYVDKLTVAGGEIMDSKIYEFCVNNGLKCRLSFCGKAGWRLQSEYNGEISDTGAGQRLAYYLGETPYDGKEEITVSVADGMTTVKAPDGSYVTVADGDISFFVADGTKAGNVTGICVENGNTAVRGELLKKEAFWGGGEHFDSINQRGKKVEINAIDKWAETRGNSYMPIPLFLTSRGSGFFMNRFERMSVDVDTCDVPDDVWQMLIYGAPCDLYVYTTKDLSDPLYGYSLISGFSPEPAEWTYGTVVCRYAPDFTTLEGILDMADKMEENDFPWDAVIAEGFPYKDADAVKEAADKIHSLGKKFMIWTPTGRMLDTVPEGVDETFYVKRADNGSINLPQAQSDNPVDAPDNNTAKYFDVTNKKVRDHIFDEYWDKLVNECGLDGAKIDFCEQFPDFVELDLADGETSGMHHLYPVLYNTFLANKFFEKDGGGMSFARGGGIGAQRYCYIWMGDQTRDYRFLPAQLKGVISSGMSGVPFTSYDMAGYQPGMDDEAGVFVRSVEFTAFTANIQTHGTILRPYDFDDGVKNIYRIYSHLHEELRPYLVEQGKISAATGMPLIRHLALEWYEDKNVWDIEEEYMLGEALLVAPVTDKGVKRDIYLPEGKWINIFDGREYDGMQTLRNYSVPLSSVPVFVKAEYASQSLADCLAASSEIIAEINALG